LTIERAANKICCFRSQINPHFISAPPLSFCWDAVHGEAYFHSPASRDEIASVRDLPGKTVLVCVCLYKDGQVPKWTKGADCKSAALWLPRFESLPAHQYLMRKISELCRALDRDGREKGTCIGRDSRQVMKVAGSPWAGVAQW
jgi:hypothetical protein